MGVLYAACLAMRNCIIEATSSAGYIMCSTMQWRHWFYAHAGEFEADGGMHNQLDKLEGPLLADCKEMLDRLHGPYSHAMHNLAIGFEPHFARQV